MKSSTSATLAPRQRLTGCQSDVGTDGALHRNLIRTGSGLSLRRDALQDGLKTAFKAPSLAISPVPVRQRPDRHLPREYHGIDPDGAFETSGDKRRKPGQSLGRTP